MFPPLSILILPAVPPLAAPTRKTPLRRSTSSILKKQRESNRAGVGRVCERARPWVLYPEWPAPEQANLFLPCERRK